jgi:AraC family transcriptional regulator
MLRKEIFVQSNISWQEERAVIEDAVADRASIGGQLITNSSGTILLASARHDEFSGIVESGPYCRIALLQSGGGRLRQKGEDVDLDGDWRPGAVSLLLPRKRYDYEAPATQFLGLAVDMDRHRFPNGQVVSARHLQAAASNLHYDTLVTSVMNALYAEAETHGTSSAFFEHGIALIFSRVAELAGNSPERRRSAGLSQLQLSRLADFVAANLAQDLTVSDLARQLGRDRTGFARAFRLSTGQRPYEYLTQQRMRRAMDLLLAGERVTAVAVTVGYSNPSKFAAAFRRLCGASPSQWAKEAILGLEPEAQQRRIDGLLARQFN